MKKVMGFNFQTMQYEQASEAEGKELLGLIESMNADSAAQLHMQGDSAVCPACEVGKLDSVGTCGECWHEVPPSA